jgi:hypothetical protein
VTLVVTGNTISGRISRRMKVTVSVCRLPLTGSRRDLRWLSGRVETPTFCVLPVFNGAVTEKCCDACGDEEYYFRFGFCCRRMPVFRGIDCRSPKVGGTYGG